MTYHINPETGNPGLCKATKSCPFGDIDKDHYASQDEARKAYESQQQTISMPVAKAKVYRNGALTPAVYKGEVLAYAEKADALKPEGRAGRLDSLYASPDLKGALRWVRANLMDTHNRPDPETYELRLNANTTYVYSIKAWEEYSWHGQPAEDYWNSGVLLKDYLANPDDYDSKEWEVLFSEKDIINATRVSKKRLVSNANEGYEQDELKTLLWRSRVK